MSDSFLLAARIPMSRQGFERWLDTPAPGVETIANPEAMFDGRYWDGRRAHGDWDGAGTTPREFFGDLVEQACTGGQTSMVLVHEDGVLAAYLLRFGHAERFFRTALLMLAGAGAVMDESADAVALFWAETGGNLLAAGDDGWLATLAVGPAGSRFFAGGDLSGPVAALRPVEDRFFELIERLAEEEEEWDPDTGPYHTAVQGDPRFVDGALTRATGA